MVLIITLLLVRRLIRQTRRYEFLKMKVQYTRICVTSILKSVEISYKMFE